MTIETPIVSFDDEPLILVDSDDRELGVLDKATCHQGQGILHRAFSLFIFNGTGELLLQQRSNQKRLWPMYWSNSCCSHPRRGETMDEAIHRRLMQELGLACDLQFVYKFEYRADFKDIGSEHELCWVYVGQIHNSVITPNTLEIAATRFINPMALAQELTTNSDDFSPWFKMEWQRLTTEFAAVLTPYMHPVTPDIRV